MAKYAPVERKIIEARERRLSRKAARKSEKARRLGDLCEATEGLAKTWRAKGLSRDKQMQLADGDVWTLQCLARYFGRSATHTVDNMRHQLKRPLYYAAENTRRRALAAERRKIRKRTTENPCPTREQVLDAWIHLKDSHEATIRFGSLIEDLACYVDSSLRFNEQGGICGRSGGVKAWLQENIPALALRYKTVMRYKALAHKLKQITEIADPTPADRIVGDGDAGETWHAEADVNETTVRTNGIEVIRAKNSEAVPEKDSMGVPEKDSMVVPEKDSRGVPEKDSRGVRADDPLLIQGKEPELKIVRARAIWKEIITGIKSCPTALVARIDALVDPERVEEATMLDEWRRRYENEITERTKKLWWKRLCVKIRVA